LSIGDIRAISFIYGSNPKRKFIVVGPSGVGKSMLINMLRNDSTSIENMNKPADVSNDISGCTSISKDYENDNYIFYDTIGLTDSRYELNFKLNEISNIIKNCVDGITGIILCFKYGRTDNETSKSLTALEKIFNHSDLMKRKLLVITWDDDNDGNVWFQRQILDKSDKCAIFLNKFCENQYICGTMKISKDLNLEKIYSIKRNNFLEQIKVYLNDIPNQSRIYLNFNYRSKKSFINKLIAIIESLLEYNNSSIEIANSVENFQIK